jgi:hypothetical protein
MPATPPDRPRYQPSGKVEAAPFLFMSGVTLTVAVAVGFIVHLCVVLRFPGVLFGPLFGGIAVTIPVGLAVLMGKCRNPWLGAMLGLASGVVVFLTPFQCDLVAARGFDHIIRVDQLPGWIDDHVHNNEIWEPGWPGKPRPVAEADVIFRYLLLAAGLLAGCSVPTLAGRFVCERPFSEEHSRWFSSWSTQLTRASGRAVTDALVSRNSDALRGALRPVGPGDSTGFTLIKLAYLKEEPTTPVYASVVLVQRGKSESTWPKWLAHRWELTPGEAAIFAEKFLIPQAVFSPRPTGTAPGERVSTLVAAKVLSVPDQEAGLILSDKNRWIATVLGLLPTFLGLGSCGLAALIAVTQADELTGWEIAAIVLGGVAIAVGALVWMGYFSDYIPSLWYHRVARRVLAERPESFVQPDDPGAFFIQMIPRKNWGRVMLENADEVGFMRLDTTRVVILFEGDRERWMIPRESVISCELEAFDIGPNDPNAGPAFWLVVLKANVGGVVWEAPIAPRPTVLAKHTPSGRRLRAEDLHRRIRGLLQ